MESFLLWKLRAFLKPAPTQSGKYMHLQILTQPHSPDHLNWNPDHISNFLPSNPCVEGKRAREKTWPNTPANHRAALDSLIKTSPERLT